MSGKIFSNVSIVPGHSLRRGLACVVEGAIELAIALRNRREVARLAELDDRMLKDIGLVRSDVAGALAEPYHVDPSAVLWVRRVERRHGSCPARVSSPSP